MAEYTLEYALPTYRYNLQNPNYVRSTAYISPLPSSVISPGSNPLNHSLDQFNLKFLLLTLDISSFLAQRIPTVIINLNNESRFCHCRSSHCTTGLNVRELASLSWSDTFFIFSPVS